RPVIPIPGQTFGQYRIIRLLGKGGMGEVYEAEHMETGRRLALKVMNHALASDQDRKRFLREGRLAASVSHPNVVYIYGSEEIGSVPVIAMELVSDGTLKDLLKRKGPLPVSEAVEAILQMVAGLEAAQNVGVLHRDIKPANCFVAADSAVKVGDFGLSVSTLARGESLLTASGAVLGTPAYASPEQLRGEDLDVRSDVYSVGATMYHLLTDRTPFAAVDFVKLITEVLDKQPEAPSAIRQDIPDELSRVMLRCLAKDRKARFQTYDELRNALLPFAARETEAAAPARRFFASIVDELVAYGPSLMFLVYWSFDPLDKLSRERTLSAVLTWLPFYLWYLAYYSVSEGLWGAAIGKHLLGLRVVDLQNRRPGLLKALLRTAVFMVPFTAPNFVLMALMPLGQMQAALGRGDILVTDWLWLVLLITLFVTMRRRNGYAAMHDLLSKTRVIVRPRSQSRPALLSPAPGQIAPAKASLESAAANLRFSPYLAKEILWKRSGQQLLNGFDPVLRRNIWIEVLEDSGGVAVAQRRELSRPGRLRWLAGGVADDRSWNAYEAVEGVPLLAAVPQPWSAVRFWLLDLAEELSAGIEEPGTAAPAAVEHIWISRQGRAFLLDFPCPTLLPPIETAARITNTGELQDFLVGITSRAIEKIHSRPQAEATIALTNPSIPLHARAFLQSLAKRSFEKSEFVLGNLQSLVSKPAEVARSRRTASLFLFPAIILICGVLLALMISFDAIRVERSWANQFPGTPSFPAAAHLYTTYQDRLKDGEDAREDVELAQGYLASQFGFLSTNETFWTQLNLGTTFTPEQRQLLKQAVASPLPEPEKIQEIEKVMPKRLEATVVDHRIAHIWIVIGWCLVCSCLLAVVEFCGCILAKNSPVLRLFSMAVVDNFGQPASPGRLLGRWALVWLPGILIAVFGLGAIILAFVTYGSVADSIQLTGSAASLLRSSATAITLAAAIIWLLGIVYAVIRPQRGIPDRLSGTWLVMR
ncbi:MAG: pknH 2, partial [Verrucomicrobiales bacterium]|nr:pknH 2 [Verrucomicrobiales bacterium]